MKVVKPKPFNRTEALENELKALKLQVEMQQQGIEKFMNALNKQKEEREKKPETLKVADLQKGEIYVCLLGNQKVMFEGGNLIKFYNKQTGTYETDVVEDDQLTKIQ